MKDVSFGQYYPVESPVHRLDPRVKLLSVVLYIVGIFFIQKFIGFAVVALFLLVAIACSRVPLMKVLRSVRAVLFLVLFTAIISVLFYSGGGEEPLWAWGIIKIYKGGLLSAARMALRLVFLVLGPSLLTLTTTPVELTDGLESLLKPLALIKLPVHELAIIMSIALRLIPTLTEETEKIMNAQKARCADFDTGNIFKRAKSLIPILIPLFVSSFRRADELADAMDSRCYRGAKGRTRMRVLKLRFRDFVAAFVMLALFFVILVLRYNWFGLGFINLLV
ncbi:energy-coupling factor transporter transmembrane component T family protein [Pumilibacter intestinalis]|uniref:energy-coupling factor transporter transmembrane component T family protein n=1 Tax=Pumilibacter intestinalis TaxID=2941511 RepID=UPI0020400E92|nr:energy-coupling factor transporter transmembrane component T [Pumilibacter intestinalis]MCI8487291.1 energy-coupling factor transporter transmembrane protein EcfT [Clostridia bacterium]